MKKHFIIGMLLMSSLAVSASEFHIGETVLRSRDTGQQEWSLATAEIVAQNGDILKLAEERRMLSVQRDEVIPFKQINAIKVNRQVITTGDVVLYKAFEYNDLLVKTVVGRLAKGDGNNLVEIEKEGVFYPARIELYKSVSSLTVNPLFSSSFVLNIGDKAIYEENYGKKVVVTVLDLTSNGYVQTTYSGDAGAYIPAKNLIAIKK